MKKKILLSLAIAMLITPAAFAVFKEKNLQNTLSVLRYELKTKYDDMERSNRRMQGSHDNQHSNLVTLMQTCQELSLMLYSQQQDFTFDITYALQRVSQQFKEFADSRLPYDEILETLDIEIERYSMLISTLENLPVLSEEEMAAALEALPDSVKIMMEEPREPDSVAAPQAQSTGGVLGEILAATGLGSSSDKEGPSTSPGMAEGNPDAGPGAGEPSLGEEEPDSLSSEGKPMNRPFELDARSTQDRDSCVFYAQAILDAYQTMRESVLEDSENYSQTSEYVQQNYDYAQKRYREVQKSIFIKGQDNYFTVLGSIGSYCKSAASDIRTKYGNGVQGPVRSEWRGQMIFGFIVLMLLYVVVAVLLSNLIVRVLMRFVPFFESKDFGQHRTGFILMVGAVIFAVTAMVMNLRMRQEFFVMASGLLVEFAWMLAAIMASLCIRLSDVQIRRGIATYLPIILLSLIIICFRIIFIPNSLILLIFPLLLLLFTIRQGFELSKKLRKMLPKVDETYSIISFVVMATATIMAWCGFCLMGLLVVVWWIFQLTFLQAITALYKLLELYNGKSIRPKMLAYEAENPGLDFKAGGAHIEVSWLYDLSKRTLLPLCLVLSIPACILMAGKVFDLSSICMEAFFKPFLTVENVIRLSVDKLIIVVSLSFVVNFCAYCSKAVYRIARTRRELVKMDVKRLETNQVNFTLSDNLFAIGWWGVYVVAAFVILHISTSALTLVCTGLATGVGLALKDILNNFFYGVQLMSGRLRVGDMIECDGVRGTVDSITYQSTQILADDGCIMAFPNSSLFALNFKNLTKNHSYLLLKVYVGVEYGTDVDKLRTLLLQELEVLRTKDRIGREIVEPNFGFQLRLMEFGDNSVNLAVYQYVNVDNYYSFAAKERELIYNVLNENGINIPFPQRDIHIKELPGAAALSEGKKDV